MPAPNDLPADSGSRDAAFVAPLTPCFDELLCEYVDGTLDEDLRLVFEECLCTNTAFADEVEGLREARALLAAHRCPCRAGRLKGGVYERLANELMRECEAQRAREAEAPSSQRRTVLFYVASLAVALTVGLALGTSLAGPADAERPSPPTALHQTAPDRAPLPSQTASVPGAVALQRTGASLDASR